MKTLELAKKAITRIAEVAVTQDQFDAWNSTKKRQWLKDHPTSKFGKKPAGKAKPTGGKSPKSKLKEQKTDPKVQKLLDLKKSLEDKWDALDEEYERIRRTTNTGMSRSRENDKLDSINRRKEKIEIKLDEIEDKLP